MGWLLGWHESGSRNESRYVVGETIVLVPLDLLDLGLAENKFDLP